MVKLSDALRGAADRAPLDGVTVSTDSAARRVSMHRGLRGAATGVVGATAIGVLALGVIGPNGLASSDSSDTDDGSLSAAAEAAPGLPDSAAGADDLAAGSQLAWGICGAPLGTPPEQDSSALKLTASAPGEADPGSSLPLTVDATVSEDAPTPDLAGEGPLEMVTTGPGALVLWDGIVVASVPQESVFEFGPADEQILNPRADLTSVALVAGETHTFAIDVPLVNCWDGAPLPAGEYELVASQEFFGSSQPSEFDVAQPDSEQSSAPAELSDPTETVPVDPEGAAPLDDAPAATVAPEGELSIVAGFRLTADPIGFAVSGEPVDNPFGDYLAQPEPPITEPVDPPTDLPPTEPLPDGSLTPNAARQMFQEGLTDDQWDMAAGTQRWVVSNDSTVPYDDQTWANSYFGCPVQGQGDGRFPARSATMDLLAVSGDVPSRIGVSYGWVVDGNPEFALTARNVSGSTLANFAPTLNSQLYLVKNGVVVAEAWGVSPSQDDGISIYNDLPMAADAADSSPAQARDLGTVVSPGEYRTPALAPGASVSSTFLWRDVNGCWDGNRQAPVAPGTYTVVSMQYLSVGNPEIYFEAEPDVFDSSGDGLDLGLDGDSPFDEPDVGAAIAPAPMPHDSVDFQVWTSLGSVSVG
ncbi:hypothetical protein [Demequina aurantiaca]|uniref:hypothetical protein n=1 Tax=Demequina aurantiaca TaxID=676200 RepID=UPI003D34F776